ncbi:MAG: hypothetical protein CL840_11940 [Crocinitomicaceae bacterium]|nr:hypothetical protein [Crocinitomicaceae bacterium]|tara:strand:- start:10495 stop:10968 length:474 start_codon:yes stop_codon:yes gene_type:complete
MIPSNFIKNCFVLACLFLYSSFVIGQQANQSSFRLNHQFWFLEKHGLVCSYKVNYVVTSDSNLTEVQRDSIFYLARSFVRHAGGDYKLNNLIFRKDSIEKELQTHLTEKIKRRSYSLISLVVDTAYIPPYVYSAILKKGLYTSKQLDSMKIEVLNDD